MPPSVATRNTLAHYSHACTYSMHHLHGLLQLLCHSDQMCLVLSHAYIHSIRLIGLHTSAGYSMRLLGHPDVHVL